MDFKTLSLAHSKVLLFIGTLQTYYTERIFISRNRAGLILKYNTIRGISIILNFDSTLLETNFFIGKFLLERLLHTKAE